MTRPPRRRENTFDEHECVLLKTDFSGRFNRVENASSKINRAILATRMILGYCIITLLTFITIVLRKMRDGYQSNGNVKEAQYFFLLDIFTFQLM